MKSGGAPQWASWAPFTKTCLFPRPATRPAQAQVASPRETEKTGHYHQEICLRKESADIAEEEDFL